MRLLTCSVGAHDYCLDMRMVRGLQRGDRLKPPPPGNDCVGSLEINRRSVPVFDVARHLGVADQARGRSRPILVVGEGQAACGLMVDRVLSEFQAGAAAVHPLPAAFGTGAGRLFRGAVVVGDNVRLVLDVAALDAEGGQPSVAPAESERTAAPSRPSTSPRSGDGRKILVFSTGAGQRRHFALSLRQVGEISPARPARPVPEALEHAPGLLAWRGLPVPLIDLDRLLGLGVAPAAGAARIVFACDPGGRWVALSAGATVRILGLPLPGSVPTPPPAAAAAYVHGAFEHDSGQLLVLDVARVLACPASPSVDETTTTKQTILGDDNERL